MKESANTNAVEVAKVIAEGCLSMRVRFLNRTLNAIYDEAYRDLGMTASQGNMLVAIVKNDELSPTRLGQLLNIEKSTLSRNLERMRKAGWIEVNEPKFGRTRSLRATRSGKSMMSSLLPRWEKAQAAAPDLLGDDESDDLKTSVDQARKKLTHA